MAGERTHGYAAPALINQELQIQQGAAAPGKPGKHILPARLLLVCSRRLEESSAYGEGGGGQLPTYSNGQTGHAHA